MAYHIGIITIDDSENFGNRLQNLAMQTFLTELGYEVKTFHRSYSPWNNMSLKKIVKFLLGRNIWISKKIFKKAYIFQRFYNFYNFNKHYITWDKYTLENISGTSYLETQYEGLVVGSDQVWNFQFFFNDKENLIPDVSSKISKIAVAASIGNISLTAKERRLFQKFLNDFDAVSVRETSAIPLLQEYYCKNVVQICDPTLLMGRRYWERLEKESTVQVREPYILVFFLGEMGNRVRVFYKKMKEALHLQVIDAGYFMDPYYGIGPIDFLKIIYDAEYVLTDSFHCCVFSILFCKKFSIYDRETSDMDASNRTDELMQMFGLINTKNLYSFEEFAKQLPLEHEIIDGVVKAERKKAERFVKEGLHINE